jgi:hypothetical protein
VLYRRHHSPKEKVPKDGYDNGNACTSWRWFPPLGGKIPTSRSWDETQEQNCPLPDDELAVGRQDRIFIFHARRRPDSLVWTVPEEDLDLLRGVGACGSSAPKGDDTFELLMLMGMNPDEDDSDNNDGDAERGEYQ